MAIFDDILKGKKTTAKDIISSQSPAGSSNLPIESSSTVKANAKKILADIKPAGSSKAPAPIVIPKRGEKISQSDGTATTVMPDSIKKEEFQKTLDKMTGKAPDDSTLGFIQNTIKAVPESTKSVFSDILQGIARTVGSVGITAGNAPTEIANKIMGTNMATPFGDQVNTNNTELGKIIFGDKPIKTQQKIINDAVANVNNFLGNDKTFNVLGKDVNVPATGVRVNSFTIAPLVVGSTLLDLYGLGGKANVATFAKDVVPESFFKYVAKESNPEALSARFVKIGLDEPTAVRLASELAPTKTVNEVKTVLVNFEKENAAAQAASVAQKVLPAGQQAESQSGSMFDNILKGNVGEVGATEKTVVNTGEKPSTKVGEDSSASLKEEAKKYNTPEEFITSQTQGNLYHGTLESINGKLRGGGYDNVLWTAKTPDVAQNYIPATGGSTYYQMGETSRFGDQSIRPEGSFAKAALRLLGFDQNKVEWSYDSRGNINGYSHASDIEIPKWDDFDKKLTEMGYTPEDKKIKTVYIDKEEVIVPKDYKKQGELYMLKEPEGLKWFDMRDMDFNGEEQYNQRDLFRKLEKQGYDGVIIDDIAQSENHGNVGHVSYGLFNHAVDKVQYTKIPAHNFDWESSGVKNVDTPDFKAYKDNLKKIWEEAHSTKPKVSNSVNPDKPTLKTLDALEGKETVSKQFISDLTNSGSIKQSERDMIRSTLSEYPDGSRIPVQEFINKVQDKTLPLTIGNTQMTKAQAKIDLRKQGILFERDMSGDINVVDKDGEFIEYDTLTPDQQKLVDTYLGDAQSYDDLSKKTQYEHVALPSDLRGKVKNYKENIYESPIETSAGDTHFMGKTKNYFGHTRIEDMADGKTRRVIEVQSDLFQKGNIDLKTKIQGKYFNEDHRLKHQAEIDRLKQYNDPTAHFRMVREEIKRAAKDSIEKLQFPTGETAMKIEGLGQTARWHDLNNNSDLLKPNTLEIGKIISGNPNATENQKWIITDVLGDGKFKAIPKSIVPKFTYMSTNNMTRIETPSGLVSTKEGNFTQEDWIKMANGNPSAETFDISTKIDTQNPIYKFYEKDMGKYLKNNYSAKEITDNKGVSWYEVNVDPKLSGQAVTAFKAKPVQEYHQDFDITPKEAENEIRKLFSDDEIQLVTGKNIAEHSGQSNEKWADAIQGFYMDRGDMSGLIGVIENGGKVSSNVLYHESGHAFFNRFLSPAERKKYIDYVLKNKAEELTKYRKDSYPDDQIRAEEWIMDDFAASMRKDKTFGKADGFFKALYKRIVETIKNILRKKTIFDDLYNRIKSKDRSYVQPKVRKLDITSLKVDEKLPKNLEEMKQLIEIKEEYVKNSPLQQLVKYQSSSRLGELPEVLGKGKGIFQKKGDQIIDQVMGYKVDYDDANDVEDVRAKFEKFMEYKKDLAKMKEDFKKKLTDFRLQRDKEIVMSKANIEKKPAPAVQQEVKKTIPKNASERTPEEVARRKEQLERITEALAETQKRLADEKGFKAEFARKVREAKQFTLKKDSLFGTLMRSLSPAKSLDKKTREIFKDWRAKLLIGKEMANSDALQFKNIPAKIGMEIINKYEAGADNSYTREIKKTFDSLYNEGKAQGLDIPYRENYLPHVYKEDPVEIKNAIASYMVDKGVEKYIIDDYMDGISNLSPELAASLKLNPSFTKQRSFPTYEIAKEYGLHPKYENPAQLIGHYRQEMQKTLANREFMHSLERNFKILPHNAAPRHWEEIKLTYGGDRWYAPKDLARVVNGQIDDVENLGFIDKAFHYTAEASKKMQEIALSAGFPASNLNFFSMGVAIKEFTSGNFKAISPFMRANFNWLSIKYFEKNLPIIKDMARQGIDLGNRIGNYGDLYSTLSTKWRDKEYVSLFGEAFDKTFNEKTFGSFMPQLYIQTFKDASKRAVKMGMDKAAADTFAGNVVKNVYGIVEDMGRSKKTEDKLSAIFFAPKFRESILNSMLTNTLGKSWTTEIRNPAFYKNRRLLAGMIITFALYNALNKKLNGNYMWDNENGKEFSLKIPTHNKNGDIVYIEFMPSQLAFIRAIGSGIMNTAKGDFETAVQKFGSVFSMPIKLTADIISNSDYFGRAIYKDSDTTYQKALKIAAYIGLSINHPYIKEVINQTNGKVPLYQSVSAALELPLKFSTEDKVATAQFYQAMDKARIEQVRAKDKFRPVYDEIKQLSKDGKEGEALEKLDNLSDSDYEMYKEISASEKRTKTISDKTTFTKTYNDIKQLVQDGKLKEAQGMIDNLSDDDYKAYKSLNAQFNGKPAK